MLTHLLLAHDCNFERLGETTRAGALFGDALEASGVPRWLADFRVRGPWLARFGQAGEGDPEVFIPVPHVLRQTKNHDARYVRLNPLSRQLSIPGLPAHERPLWIASRDSVERSHGYLNRAGLSAFLAGGVPAPKDVNTAETLYGFDRRTGISIDRRKQTADDGLIYAASFLALKPGIAWYTEVSVPEEADLGEQVWAGPMRFGGEGKFVEVQKTRRYAWPEVEPVAGQGKLLLLTTPAVTYAGAERSSLLEDAIAVAADGFVAISGWDLARRGPKPTRFAVPAGATYFFTAEQSSKSWEPMIQTEVDEKQGWGCYLKGIWNDE